MSLIPAWLQTIVTASCYASILAALVLAAQWLLKLPPRWRFALWLLVLARLVPLPLPESRASLFNLLPRTAASAPRVVSDRPAPQPPAPLPIPAAVVFQTPSPVHTPADSVAPVAEAPRLILPQAITPAPARESRPFPWPATIALAYLAGLAAMLLRQLLATRALHRLIRAGTPAEDRPLLSILAAARATMGVRRPLPLLLVNGLGSPALAGYLRPKLLLPAEMAETLSPQDLRHIFLHECAHLRRHDVLLNYALAILLGLHWFNPLLYVLLPRIRADRELATDELALAHAEPASYGETLLNLFAAHTAPSPLAGNPASVAITETRSYFTRRIQMIAQFKKPPAWLSIPAAIALVAATACTLTAPVSRAGAPATPATPAASDNKLRGAAPLKVNTTPAASIFAGPAAANPFGGTATIAGPVAIAGPYPAIAESPGQARSDAENLATRAKLEEVMAAPMNVDQVPMSKAVEFLRDSSGLGIQVNWKALEAAGIDRNAAVSVNLGKVPLRRALSAVLNSASGTVNLGYTVEDGMVFISTVEDLRADEHTTTRIYNIRPLLGPAIDADAMAASVSNLLDLLRSSIDPTCWVNNGGKSSLVEYNGLLTVRTSSDLQYQVAQFLGTLSQADAQSPRAHAAAAAADDVRRQAESDRRNAESLAGQLAEQLKQQKEANADPAQIARLEQQLTEAQARVAAAQQAQASLEARKAADLALYAEKAPRPAPAKKAEKTNTFTIDIGDIIGLEDYQAGVLTADQRQMARDLEQAVRALLDDQNTRISSFGSTLVVITTDSNRERIRDLLQSFKSTHADQLARAKELRDRAAKDAPKVPVSTTAPAAN